MVWLEIIVSESKFTRKKKVFPQTSSVWLWSLTAPPECLRKGKREGRWPYVVVMTKFLRIEKNFLSHSAPLLWRALRAGAPLKLMLLSLLLTHLGNLQHFPYFNEFTEHTLSADVSVKCKVFFRYLTRHELSSTQSENFLKDLYDTTVARSALLQCRIEGLQCVIVEILIQMKVQVLWTKGGIFSLKINRVSFLFKSYRSTVI